MNAGTIDSFCRCSHALLINTYLKDFENLKIDFKLLII